MTESILDERTHRADQRSGGVFVMVVVLIQKDPLYKMFEAIVIYLREGNL